MRALSSPDDIDITELWRAVRRGLPYVIVTTICAALLTYGVLSLTVKRYTSEAQLAVVAKGAANPFTDPTRAGSPELLAVPVDKEAINTHVRAMMSSDLGAQIATDLKLAKRVEFNNALGSEDTISAILRLIGLAGPRQGESDLDRVLSVYDRRLDVYSPKESRFIGIRFTSSDPTLAAEIPNRLAALYRERLATVRVTETDDVQKALEPKIAKLKDEVAAADAEVERFRATANIFRGGPQSTGLNEQQLGELTAELTRAKAARSEADARARSARELVQRDASEVLPDVQRSPLIQNLVQQRVRVERQISELSATLLPGHPRMKQLLSELAGLKRQINSEVGKIASGLDKEATIAALREESIRNSLDEIKARVTTGSGDEAKLRQLEANAASKRVELARMQAQFESNRARADNGAVPVEAQIIAAARPSSVPSSPKKLAHMALAMAATMLFGLAWVVTRALLIGARSRSGRASGHPAAGLASRARHDEMPALAEATVALNEGIEVSPPAALARNLRLRSMDAIAKHLLSTARHESGFRSVVVGEGQSIDAGSEALELAHAIAKGGANVVIIDWGLNGGSVVANKLGLAEHPGVRELLDGSKTFESVVRRDAASNVHVIPSGVRSCDAQLLQDPERINLVLDALDEVYDQIVVCGPYEPVRALFETIEGRFDAGITVADPRRRVSVLREPPNTFLGFEVTEIELLRYERKAPDAVHAIEPPAKIKDTELVAG